MKQRADNDTDTMESRNRESALFANPPDNAWHQGNFHALELHDGTHPVQMFHPTQCHTGCGGGSNQMRVKRVPSCGLQARSRLAGCTGWMERVPRGVAAAPEPDVFPT